MDRDALAVIVGARSLMGEGVVALQWTSMDVASLLWSGVAGWSTVHGVRQPVQVTSTLGTYLRYLSAHRLFDQGSDAMTVLRRALAEHDTTEVRSRGRAGARSRHPAAGAKALAPVLPIC